MKLFWCGKLLERRQEIQHNRFRRIVFCKDTGKVYLAQWQNQRLGTAFRIYVTPMFPCDTCTQFRGVFYCSKIVNTDNIPFQTNAWNMQNNRQCYRMGSAHMNKIRSVMAAFNPVWFQVKLPNLRDICSFYQIVRCYNSYTPVPSAVRKGLAPLQVGGTTALMQGTARDVVGRQIERDVVQHHWITFFIIFFLWQKQLYKHEAKSHDSWLNDKIIFVLSRSNILEKYDY
jgi:hypothetical protein